MNLSVTQIVHDLVQPHVLPGDTVLDATAGNGHDTLFLARCVGPTGLVFAWDIQPLALERTAAKLAGKGIGWVELILGDHAQLNLSPLSASARGLGGEIWPGDLSDLHLHTGRPHPPAPSPKRRGGESPKLAAAMFNLGYLPAGDKSLRTTPESSLQAIRAAVDLLAPGGILTVVAYTGHEGGAAEAEAIREMLEHLPKHEYQLREVTFPAGRSAPPRLFVLQQQSS